MNLYLKTKDHFNTQEEFELFYDPGFEMLVTSPQPKQLAPYYQSTAYISHTDNTKGILNKIYQLVKAYSLKRKLKLINSFHSPEKTLLDIGAGTGDFILNAQKNNWRAFGIEPNIDAKTKAESKGVKLKANYSELEENQFDVITLWHVLEHLPDLSTQLTKITSLLKENGTLVIAVPNFKSYDAKKYTSYWAAYDVPRHLWHFSRDSFPLLFQPHGMKVIGTKPMLFDSFYVSLLSEKYKYGKQNYLNALINGFISNLKAYSTKEYSSIIYLLKKDKKAL